MNQLKHKRAKILSLLMTFHLQVKFMNNYFQFNNQAH